MEGNPDYLENLRRKLSPHLPASIQAYNSVSLALSDDGIERRVVSTPDQLQCSVLVLNRGPGAVRISMFSSSDADDDLKKLLEENIDWSEFLAFVVSLVKELGNTDLCMLHCRVSIRDMWILL